MISNITSSNHSDMNYLPDHACYCMFHSGLGTATSTTSQASVIITTIVLVIIGSAINIKWIKNLEQEKRTTPIIRKGNVAYSIMSLYAMIQVLATPPLLLYCLVLQLGSIESNWHPPWLCYIGKAYSITFMTYHSFHSLCVAMVRYCFIVHENKVNDFGIQRTKDLFYYLSFVVPITIALGLETTNTSLLLIHTPPYRQCIESSYNISNMNNTDACSTDVPNEAYTTVVYHILTKVIPNELVDGITIFFMTMLVIVLSNLVEGCLYCMMFWHMKR